MLKRNTTFTDGDDFTPHIPKDPVKSRVGQLGSFISRNVTALSIISLTFILLASANINQSESNERSNNYFRNRGANNDVDLVMEQTKIKGFSKALTNLANVDEPVQEGDVPLFLHFPRSGGGMMTDIMGGCLGLTLATAGDDRNSIMHEKELQVIKNEDGSSFVNVDMSTYTGIHRAVELNLIESKMADAIVTRHLHSAAALFNEKRRGRVFVLMRHPVERANSMFHYLGTASWDPAYDPNLAYISIEMYARSQRPEHNWLTRVLSNEMEGELTHSHLQIAKTVLRKKCIITLLESKRDALTKIEAYFGWKFETGRSRECRERFLHSDLTNKHPHPGLYPSSGAYDLLVRQNNYDMELWEYAHEVLKKHQGKSWWKKIKNGGDCSWCSGKVV